MSFVRTVLGDMAPQQMGFTCSHEHIIIEESFPTLANKDFLLNDVEKAVAELTALFAAGGRTMVDTMPANCGRNILKLAEVSKRSGIHIIASTGIHLEKYYPPRHWQHYLNEEQITDLLVQDVTAGIDEYDYNGPLVNRTKYKAGVLKLATGEEPFSSHQLKIFRAVVNAHRETGCPILTHTTDGMQAIEQAEEFIRLGADIKHIVLSHVDRNKDLGYHRALMQTGVYVEYDSHFRWKNETDNWTYTLLEKLLPDFYGQITIGMDLARNSYWKSYGGSPGLNYLSTTFRGEMVKRGLTEFIQHLFFDNPQHLFSFTSTHQN